MTNYQTFLESKIVINQSAGFDVDPTAINPVLFGHQRAIVQLAVQKGRFAIFADVGLGKTLMQVEWARLVGQRTLIIAPLAVTQQTIAEARKHLDIEIRFITDSAQVT